MAANQHRELMKRALAQLRKRNGFFCKSIMGHRSSEKRPSGGDQKAGNIRSYKGEVNP